MSLDNDQYRQLFIEEAKEHIETITKSMLILEKDPANQEIINMLFRSAHTLKGSSGMMGFKDFQQLTHDMEDVFDGMRKGNKPNSNLISLLLECVDALSKRLENIENKTDGEIAVAELSKRLKSSALPSTLIDRKTPCNETLSQIEFNADEKQILKTAQSKGEQCYWLDSKFSEDCAFKTVRANMLLEKVSALATIVKTFPAMIELSEEELGHGFQMAVTSKCSEKELENCAQQVCEIKQVKVSEIEPASPQKEESKSTSLAAEEAKLLADVRSAQTIRVKFDHLDNLMNWVGELVINKIALLQVTADSRNGNEGLKRITENIDRLTADLQDLVMKVRMVPVSQVFDRFPRLIRDLSLKKGKQIDLLMDGREIEVDRTILDEIGEPLIHLLRNSVDHGIEKPEDRKKCNKPPTGKITLSAQRNGDQVIIEVKDDGAGIDPEKIKTAALKKRFAKQSELEKMSNEQLVNMIFLPGFSTASEVNETSGRGVGMDVVKTKITALGGTVHIESQIGKGTRTSIKLPLTLAIIQAILVTDTGQTFAIPTSQVSEIVRVKKSEIKSLGKSNAIIIRDHVIPIVHLHQLLSLSGKNDDELELLITYLGDENTKLALAVDSVLQQQDILVKALNKTLSKIKGISGATILGDGQVVLVLDVCQLVNKVMNKSIGLNATLA